VRAIVIQHEHHEGAGLIEPALAGAGFTPVPRFRAVAPGDATAELVVVMGGGMSAWETEQHPFLAAERALLADRLRRDAPCLGVCLGAQLLALAAGADVTRGENGLEIGIAPVRWTDAARDDAVIGSDTADLDVAHWHQDTFTAVPGGVLLASTDRYEQQAFRIGRSYGFQFHVEVDARTFARWIELAANDLVAQGCDAAALRDEAATLQRTHDRRTALLDRLAQHFSAAASPR
jgi:GMP synthase (glutamine-hydrolysing)